MTRHVKHFRDKALLWLLGVDTRLSEFTLGCAAIINGVQAVTTRNGQSLAPFLNSAFSWLHFDAVFWLAGLTAMGVLRLFCLALGMVRNNAYLPRGIISLLDGLMWAAIVTAIVTSPQPSIVAARYALAAFVSLIVALVLWLRFDVAHDERLRHLWPNGAVERRCDAER